MDVLLKKVCIAPPPYANAVAFVRFPTINNNNNNNNDSVYTSINVKLNESEIGNHTFYAYTHEAHEHIIMTISEKIGIHICFRLMEDEVD